MKRLVIWFACVAVLAALVHVAAVWAAPRIIMAKVMSRIGGSEAVNSFVEPARATADTRWVVRPSPDLAYSVCILDLSKGPVRVRVPLTGPYTSVALYSSATDNYFVENGREAASPALDILVAPPGASKPANVPEGARLIEAPAMKGLVLVRRVIESDAAFEALDKVRRQASCAPFQG